MDEIRKQQRKKLPRWVEKPLLERRDQFINSLLDEGFEARHITNIINITEFGVWRAKREKDAPLTLKEDESQLDQ